MINFLAKMFQTEPAVVWVALVIALIFLAIAVANANKKGPDYTYSGNQVADAANKRLADFEFVERMGDIGKKIYKAIANAIIEGTGGNGVFVIIFVFLLIVGFSIYALLDFAGAVKSSPAVVKPGETCVRQGVALSEGTTLQAWDICNGKVIEPTAIPATLAPTLTPAPVAAIMVSPTVQVLPSVTPIPTEEQSNLIKVVLLNGIPAEQGWMNSPSLDGYRQVSEAKCGNQLEIPANTTFAFVLFEGGRDNWLVSKSIVNVNDTRVTVDQNKVEINYCKSGSWFSLWVK